MVDEFLIEHGVPREEIMESKKREREESQENEGNVEPGKRKPKEEDNDEVFNDGARADVFTGGARADDTSAQDEKTVKRARDEGDETPKAEANEVAGVKRKASDKENPKDKTRRLTSPVPMSVGEPNSSIYSPPS